MSFHRPVRRVASLLLGVLGLFAAVPALAAQYAVTTTDDRRGHACTPTDCSLREAIIAANRTAEPDEIILPAGLYALTVTGRQEDSAVTGDLDVIGDLTLTGAGATESIIDGMHEDRVFEILGGTVAMSHLTIQNGDSGGFPGGGGIYNKGSLTLDNCVVRQNSAGSGGGGPFRPRGGGILSVGDGGELTVTDSTVDGNSVGGDGSGGGIVAANNSVTLTGSTLSHNSAEGVGNPFSGIGAGGGLILDQSLLVHITNCTFSGNSAGPSLGSAILAAGSVGFVTNCTFAGNLGLTAVDVLTGVLTLSNTLLANSGAGDNCGPLGISSQSGNLSDDASCAFPLVGDRNDVPAELAELADNGGPTQTHALLPESPAIDAGDPAVCAYAIVGGVDQRGDLRPGAGSANCSIGAYEFAAAGPPTPTATVTATPTPTPTSTPSPVATSTSTATPIAPTPQIGGGGGCTATRSSDRHATGAPWIFVPALLLWARRRPRRSPGARLSEPHGDAEHRPVL